MEQVKPWSEMTQDEKEKLVDSYLLRLRKKLIHSAGFQISTEYDTAEFLKGGKVRTATFGEEIYINIRYAKEGGV